MNRPPKRAKDPKVEAKGVFGVGMPKGDPDSQKAAMGLRLNGPPSHRKRKPTR